MLLSQYLFFFLSFVAIISAILMVLDTNPVHSVLFLVVTFFAIAGHYLLLNAQFLAAVHIIVYAGAIMVLFLYVIMMLNLNKEIEPHKEQIPKVIAALAAGMLLISLVYAVRNIEADMMTPLRNSDVGLVQNLGMSLYKEYMLPFEISAVLFLSAMVGAVFLSKKDLNQP